VTRTWRMFAGRPSRVVDGREFMDFGDERTVRFRGSVPVPVELTEDPGGTYWGWIVLDDGPLDRPITGIPTMVQPHEGMFRMQSPDGFKAHAEAGRGEIVRMTCREAAVDND
jgi:hypothetical protein